MKRLRHSFLACPGGKKSLVSAGNVIKSFSDIVVVFVKIRSKFININF